MQGCEGLSCGEEGPGPTLTDVDISSFQSVCTTELDPGAVANNVGGRRGGRGGEVKLIKFNMNMGKVHGGFIKY